MKDLIEEATEAEKRNILRGNNLFKYLFDQELPHDFEALLKDFRSKKKVQRKQKKNIGKNSDMKYMKQRLADIKAGIKVGTPIEAPWEMTKLLLHVTEYTCVCCGTKAKAPDSPILIQFSHPRKGTKTEIADGRGIELPRQIIYSFRETAGCHLCFDLETMILDILVNKYNCKPEEEKVEQ